MEETLTCPITHQIFCYPITINDGHTYELRAISEWLKNHNTSPITNEQIIITNVKPNYLIINLVENYLKKIRIKHNIQNMILTNMK